MSHRLSLISLIFAIGGCSPNAPPASSGAAQVSPPAADSAYPFPTIHGATREDALISACLWARDHYRAPQRANADTPVIYHSTTGMLSDGRPDIGILTMERGTAAALGFRDSFVSVDLEDALAAARARGLATPFDHYHLIGLRHEIDDAIPGGAWCPEQGDQSAFADYGRGVTACLRHTQVSAASPRSETLEQFTNVPVQISDDILIAWSGYRWSGGGGALILEPTVDRPSGSWAIDMGAHCPEIVMNGNGEISHVPAYLDRSAWIEMLAPAQLSSTATSH